jgi:2-dehydro-3-deoxyphosphooctonate aldolase (KDO 8-P synthase)
MPDAYLPISHRVTVGNVSFGPVTFGNDLPFALIAGPCQMESRDHAIETSHALKEIAEKVGIGLVYKSSFDKANRTSASAARGIGFAAAQTGRVVNVKKGQFLAPGDMANVARKVTDAGNPNVLLTERGVSFGYNTLVNDMRALPVMARTGHPVIFDATHSVQQPGGLGDRSGGDRTMVPVLARAAIAVGVAGVFMETHEDPDNAPSDGPNMVKLKDMPALIEMLMAFDKVAKAFPG